MVAGARAQGDRWCSCQKIAMDFSGSAVYCGVYEQDLSKHRILQLNCKTSSLIWQCPGGIDCCWQSITGTMVVLVYPGLYLVGCVAKRI